MNFSTIVEQPELVQEYLACDPVRSTVYICGSTAEGFGNSKSDIDIYVIGTELPDLHNADGRVIDCGTYKINNQIIGSARIDIEYWTFREVKRLQKVLEDYKIGGDKLKLNEEEIDFLHRLKFAIPLFGQELFHEMRASTRFDQFDRGLVISHINIYSGLVEDIDGCMADGDLYTALTASRLLLDRAIDAFLASRGETNARPKWRMRKLLRAFGEDSEVFKNYMRLQFLVSADKEQIKQHVEDVLMYCQHIVIKSQDILLEESLHEV